MLTKDNVTKIILGEEEIPKFWYNIQADMPNKISPYYNPVTKELATPSDMQAIFTDTIIEQEFTKERYVEIPKEVREKYKKYRPSPVYRARELEKLLGTPARIYYKYEGGNATGSHKLNTALAQAFYNKEAGIKRISTETGAGQWGSALSMACESLGMECAVYMVRVSYDQKPYRRHFMETFGASVTPSPSMLTNSGRAILAADPNTTGSLGIAISEAVEDAATHDDTKYALGSVMNHVCMHQTIIGLESKKQLEVIDEYPDMVIACAGGGSNFSGIAFPFVKDKIEGKNVRCIAVEPASCPTLTKGVFAFDYGDTAKLTPILEGYTLGHDFTPPGIHAGGLRYHGESPIVSRLYHDKLIEACSYHQTEVFEAAVKFARAEGIVPAPESSHAIKKAVDEALICKETGEEKVILFCLSGHGYFDFTAYDMYLSGKMADTSFDENQMKKSLEKLPSLN